MRDRQFIAAVSVYCSQWTLSPLSQVIPHVLTSGQVATMTHHSDDQAPGVSAQDTGYFSSEARGGSSSEAGSGGSSCDHHHDDVDSDHDDTMDTIKRNIKTEPIRPPRTIDMAPHSLDYYNLCHPPPSEPAPAPALPRRAPYISHGAAEQCQWPGGDTVSRCGSSMSTLTSRHNIVNSRQQRKYLTTNRRQRKGSVCNCKHATGKIYPPQLRYIVRIVTLA